MKITSRHCCYKSASLGAEQRRGKDRRGRVVVTLDLSLEAAVCPKFVSCFFVSRETVVAFFSVGTTKAYISVSGVVVSVQVELLV